MKKVTLVFIMAIMLTNSCIDRLDINVGHEEFILVVEGFITTQPGPHIIKLSRSARFGSSFGLNGILEEVENAKVSIRDQNGKVTLLTEEFREFIIPVPVPMLYVTSIGDYATPTGFRAVVGNSYTLQIITKEGKTYQSTPELVTKVPEIDSLILKYKELPSLDPIEFSSGNNVAGDFVSGVEVFSQWQDPGEDENYYRWQSSGTYKILTHPDKHVIFSLSINVPDTPDPKDCCSICWIDEPESDVSHRIMKDNNSNGNLVTNLVAFIVDDGGRYMEKYFIGVEQHSISEEAFLFFKLLNNQLSINGDIFDPPPATIRGNMISLDNPDDDVIGYFMASDVSVKSVFIPKDILEEKRVLKVINDDCRVLFNSTIQRPSFWE